MKPNFTKSVLVALLCFFGMGSALAQLSGTYTIDPSSSASNNYTSVVAAASALSSVGVSGPVTFVISDGTYSGQVSLYSISGASATNTIKFIGKSNDSTKVILTNSSTYTIYMSGAKYVTFEDLTVTTSYSSSYAIYLSATSYNTFRSVRVITTYMGVYDPSASTYNTFDKMYITGGSYGMYIYGNSSSLSSGNKVINSVIHNTGNYGLLFYYQRDCEINHVDIDSVGYGLYTYYNNNSKVLNSKFNCNYYHYTAYYNYTSVKTGDTSLIMNNQFMNGGATSYGLYGYYCQRTNIFHNSYDLKGTAYGVYWYYPTGSSFLNNNIKMEGATYGMYLYSTPARFDYNNLDLKGGSAFCVFNTSTYSSFSALKSAFTAYNQHSFNVDPEFYLAGRDLRSSSSVLNNNGLNTKHKLAKTDFDGNPRPSPNDAPKVDIGCNDYYLSDYDLDVWALNSPLSVGASNQISVAFKNAGSKTIAATNVSVQYSVDSGKTWVTETMSMKSLSAGGIVNYAFTTTWSPKRTGKFQISVRINPQISGDPDISDRKDWNVCSGLAGTYTIGTGKHADFNSFNAAVTALKCGVAGPIVFNVRPGTYTERVELGQFSGASATNTVTFHAASPDSVTLQYNATSNSNQNTLTFNGTDYVAFENMRIEADGSSYGFAVHMWQNANYNRISGCIIQANPTAASSYSSAMCLSGSATSPTSYGETANYNLFEDNSFIGGYYGVTVMGSSTTNMTEGNEFYNNHFTKAYYMGIYMYYNSGVVFQDNVVEDFRSSGYSGYVYYMSNFDWQRNTFSGTSSTYGFIFGYPNYYNYKGNRSQFINNKISGANTNYAFYSYYMTNVDFFHNSIYGSGSYLCYIPYGSGSDVRNNIFYFEGSSYMFYMYNPSYKEFDYNDIYIKSSAPVAYISGTVKSSVSDFNSWDPSYNQHNFSEDPQWVDKLKDLHVTSKFPEMYGANVGVELDGDRDLRCKFAPSLGADEFKQISLPPTANFLAPDTAWLGSPTILLNANKPSKLVGAMWYVNGKLTSDSIHLQYVPKNVGMDTITLIMENCSGKDSITKYVYVSRILRAPDVDFSATSVDIYTYEIIRLLDLSTNGATSWSWDISPKLAYDAFLGVYVPTNYFDTSKANPSGYFAYPGIYTVKLRVASSYGADSLVRTAYIKVRQSAKMCDIPWDTDGSYGTLYDNGGENGSYSPGLNGTNKCTYLVSSCKGEIDLSVDQFDLGEDDYLKVYDGNDDTGRPLWDAASYPDGMTGNKTDKSVTLTFTAKSGSAYFVFESDNSTQTVGKGFAIDWEYRNVTWTNPTASINSPDTACTGFPTVFENASLGNWSYVEWDVDQDGIGDGNEQFFSHTYNTPGTYTITLRAYSLCAGKDSITKTIVIEDATKAAKPDFTASATVIPAGDTITISGSANYCVSGFAWSITPSNYLLANNTKLTDPTIDILFTKGGFYTIKLESFNPSGKDSLVKVNYIQVLDYCTPSVVNLDADLGISRVAFGSIDNKSAVGKDAYSNFLHMSTDVERGHSYPITIERATNNKEMSRKVWIDWNIDGDFDDAGELVVSEDPSTTLSFTDTIIVAANAKPGKTRMRISTNYKKLKNAACGPHVFGEFEDYSIIVLEQDLTPPTLTLKGALTDTIEVFGTWTESGYSAYDLVDGNLTSAVVVNSSLDNTIVGTYTISYEVEDDAKNKTTATRTVVVLDKTFPTISLKGADSIWVQIFTPYNELGENHNDNYDKSMTADVYSNVDTDELGVYTVTYCVTDNSGNGPVCVTRVVTVGDSIAPVASLIGNSPEIVDVFTSYEDAGITVLENHGYTVTTSGTWTGSPDVLGTYTLTYTVTDYAGNSVSVTREIEVVDRVSPDITLEGNLMETVERWSDYTDAGYTVSDNYDAEVDIEVTIGGTFVNTQSEGVYTITYIAKDKSGNESSTLQRVVVVAHTNTGVGTPSVDGYQVYPNPTSGVLVVNTSLDNGQTTQLRVLDLTGKVIYNAGNHVVSNGQFALDLSNLSTGTYYLEITSADARVVEKVVIAR